MRGLTWSNESLRQGCVLFPIPFNIFFVAVLDVILQRFAADAVVLPSLVHLDKREGVTEEGAATTAWRAVWGLLYADDAGVVS